MTDIFACTSLLSFFSFMCINVFQEICVCVCVCVCVCGGERVWVLSAYACSDLCLLPFSVFERAQRARGGSESSASSAIGLR